MSKNLPKIRQARKARALVAAGATLVAATAAACSNAESADNGASSDPEAVAAAEARLEPYLIESEKIAVTTPLDSEPPEGKLLYLIRYNIPIGAALDEPTEEAAEALGRDLEVFAVDPTDPQAQSNAIKHAVAEGADFIEVSSGSAESMGDGLTVAKEAGVPVFLQAGTTEPAGEKNGIYANSNNQFVNESVLRLLDMAIVDSKGAGDVLLISAPDYPIVAASAEAAEDEFPKNCEECSLEVLNVSAQDLTAGATPSLAVATFRTKPEIKYVVATFDSLASGLPQALQAAGLNDVKVLVGAPDETEVPGLADGSFTAFAMHPGKSIAWLAVDQIARYSIGMDVEQETHGGQQFPIWTSENAPDGEVSYEGVDGYEDQYKALWNAS